MAKKSENGKRSFRFTVLEALLAGLIGLGVLYLVAVWGGAFAPVEVEKETAATIDAKELNRALAATERVLARVASLEKDNADLRKQLKSLGAGEADQPSGQAGDKIPKPKTAKDGADPQVLAALNQRMDKLETVLKGLKERPVMLDPELAERLEGLESGLAEVREKANKGQDPSRRLDQLEAAVKGLSGGGGEATLELVKRIDGLERNLAGLEKKPPVPPALDKRLAGLEERLKEAEGKPEAAVQGLEKKLAEVDRKLAGVSQRPGVPEEVEEKLEELDGRIEKVAEAPPRLSPEAQRRLDQLEETLAKLARRPAVDPDMEKRLARVEEAAREAGTRPAGDPALSKNLAERLAKVEDSVKGLDSGKGGLERRLAGLETKVDKLPAGTSGPSRADEKMAERLALLEKNLASLGTDAAKTGSKGGPASPELTARLDGLERELQAAKENPAAKPNPWLVRRLDQVEAVLQETRRQVRGAEVGLPALEARMQQQEEEMSKLRNSLRKVHAPVADPDLVHRVVNLEKGLKEAAPDKDQEAREAALAKQLETMTRRQEELRAELKRVNGLVAGLEAPKEPAADLPKDLNKRLAGLEDRMAALAKLSKNPPVPATAELPRDLEKRLAALEEHLATLGRLAQNAPAATSASRAAPPVQTAQASSSTTYTVKRGDTLYAIARRYNVQITDLRRWNPQLEERTNLYVGEDILVFPGRTS